MKQLDAAAVGLDDLGGVVQAQPGAAAFGRALEGIEKVRDGCIRHASAIILYSDHQPGFPRLSAQVDFVGPGLEAVVEQVDQHPLNLQGVEGEAGLVKILDQRHDLALRPPALPDTVDHPPEKRLQHHGFHGQCRHAIAHVLDDGVGQVGGALDRLSQPGCGPGNTLVLGGAHAVGNQQRGGQQIAQVVRDFRHARPEGRQPPVLGQSRPNRFLHGLHLGEGVADFVRPAGRAPRGLLDLRVLGKGPHGPGQPQHRPYDQPAQRQIEQQASHQRDEQRQRRNPHRVGSQLKANPGLVEQQFNFRIRIGRAQADDPQHGIGLVGDHDLERVERQPKQAGFAQIDAPLDLQARLTKQHQLGTVR